MREKSVVSDLERRNLSRDAMRHLLDVASAKVENGVEGSLPAGKISEAKEYFVEWKRRKMFESNKFAFFMAGSALIFFFFPRAEDTLFGFVAGLLFLLSFYFLMEYEKRKGAYIKEMLGDLSHFTEEKRSFYAEGLLAELWRVRETINTKRFILLSALLIVTVVASVMMSKILIGQSLTWVIVFIMSVTDVVTEKRITDEDLYTE